MALVKNGYNQDWGCIYIGKINGILFGENVSNVDNGNTCNGSLEDATKNRMKCYFLGPG
jgi:hypothetical protein